MKKENNTSWSFPWGWLTVASSVITLVFLYEMFNVPAAPSWVTAGAAYSLVAFTVFLVGWCVTTGWDKVDEMIENDHHSMQKYY